MTRLKLNILDIERDSTKFIIHSGEIIFISNVLKIVFASGKIMKEHLFPCLTGFFGQPIDVLKLVGLFLRMMKKNWLFRKTLLIYFVMYLSRKE